MKNFKLNYIWKPAVIAVDTQAYSDIPVDSTKVRANDTEFLFLYSKIPSCTSNINLLLKPTTNTTVQLKSYNSYVLSNATDKKL